MPMTDACMGFVHLPVELFASKVKATNVLAFMQVTDLVGKRVQF
jgi:hypothetical protein